MRARISRGFGREPVRECQEVRLCVRARGGSGLKNIYLSIYISIYLSMYPSIHLSIYLYIIGTDQIRPGPARSGHRNALRQAHQAPPA